LTRHLCNEVMPAETLNCPMCGAAAASESTRCEHCGARLATVACPSCFGMMFLGQKFCPHCGAKADRRDPSAEAPTELCPRCKTNLEAVVVGASNVRECPKCEGIWTDTETLRQICADREKQAAVLGMPTHLPSNEGVELEKQIRYLPCPVCGDLMNRINFANFSNVIVDVCREHGTWFDRDELRRIVEFIRAGGMDQARAREIQNLEADRRLARADQFLAGHGAAPVFDDTMRHTGVAAVADLLLGLLR
jgi:Zn-finger nucleic acid-binding protein